MELSLFFKSVLESDPAPIVICDLAHAVVYMNKAARIRYHKDLTGKSILSCHNAASCAAIERVLSWFSEGERNNVVYTSRNDGENKDVYMVALRDSSENLIGYYEKHEFRTPESRPLYVLIPDGE